MTEDAIVLIANLHRVSQIGPWDKLWHIGVTYGFQVIFLLRQLLVGGSLGV